MCYSIAVCVKKQWGSRNNFLISIQMYSLKCYSEGLGAILQVEMRLQILVLVIANIPVSQFASQYFSTFRSNPIQICGTQTKVSSCSNLFLFYDNGFDDYNFKGSVYLGKPTDNYVQTLQFLSAIWSVSAPFCALLRKFWFYITALFRLILHLHQKQVPVAPGGGGWHVIFLILGSSDLKVTNVLGLYTEPFSDVWVCRWQVKCLVAEKYAFRMRESGLQCKSALSAQ